VRSALRASPLISCCTRFSAARRTMSKVAQVSPAVTRAKPVLFHSYIYITALRTGDEAALSLRRLAVDSPIWLSVVLWTKAQLQSGIQSDRLHRPFALSVGNLERVNRRAGAAHRGARSIGTVPPPAPWFEMHLRSAMAMLKLIPRRRIAERP